MASNLDNHIHWPHGTWTNWWRYCVRWLVFAVVVQVFQPVEKTSNGLLVAKLAQLGTGLLFGLLCAAVFTVAENKLNATRVRWRSWLLVLLTWGLVKACFVTALAWQ